MKTLVDTPERAFYLGRSLEEAPQGAEPPEGSPLHYAGDHLTTHGVVVGMTGSGKTGLGVILLEEAALAGIPAIVVDPKGDMGNLLLTFPELRTEDFAPWAPPGEDPAELAARARAGLERSGQGVERLRRFDRVERLLYTPGARIARPLSLLPSLTPPPVGTPVDVARDRAVTAASGLLALAGLDPDPVRSPEHTLVAHVMLDAYTKRLALDPSSLLAAIQEPPFQSLGAMPLETVVPRKARTALAVRLNTAFASPALAGMLEGEALDIQRLLYAEDGRPRISVLSIAHLSDDERTFFLTVLLGELLSWVRSQSGTSRLRALFYMDEVYGFFPPVAQPPTKAPMLTLLKQARAYGLGLVLATQNPVDLDYKGLSNTGTWMIGRLQTERDKLRVLDGLEGAAAATGSSLERAELDRLLSGLGKRVFLMHDVHEGAPRLFRTRWALSYLRGPLSRQDMRRLVPEGDPALSPREAPQPASDDTSDDGNDDTSDDTSDDGSDGAHDDGSDGAHDEARAEQDARDQERVEAQAVKAPGANATPAPQVLRPEVPIAETFVVRGDVSGPLHYRPGLLVALAARHADARAGVEIIKERVLVCPLDDEGPSLDDAWVLEPGHLVEADEPAAQASSFGALPRLATRASTFDKWARRVRDHVARELPITLSRCRAVELVARGGESADAFAARVAKAAASRLEEEISKVEDKFAPKLQRARAKLEDAERKLADATADRDAEMLDAGIAFGASVLGALTGGRKSRRSASAAAKRAARLSRARAKAQEDIAKARDEIARVEKEKKRALAEAQQAWEPARLSVEPLALRAKKTDIAVERVVLAWVPAR